MHTCINTFKCLHIYVYLQVVHARVGMMHILAELRRGVKLLNPDTRISVNTDAQISVSTGTVSTDTHKPGCTDTQISVSTDNRVFNILCELNKEIPVIPFTCKLCGMEDHMSR
jgi:hypothetical protein